eukprot:scaffold5087_cov82-Skeletonema_dohrnii-CCMP3373.AAC.3
MGEAPRARNTAQNTLTTWHAGRLYGAMVISLVEQQVITALMAGMMVSLNIDLDDYGIVSERHSKYLDAIIG